ncbi:MAG: hypothetical protein B7Y53_06275 [Halothiobacillus sp. 28-55-5]|nr:MAG: hypothetical protein B7Y53_06275 [Halothiobacillus sp. 28-55-5]
MNIKGVFGASITLLIGLLTGCAVVSTTASVTGAVVSTAVGVTTTAVGVGVDATKGVVSLATPN